MTTDSGKVWKDIDSSFTTKWVNSFLLYGNYVFAAGGDALYVSKDHGISWKKVFYGSVDEVIIKGNYIFIAQSFNGIYRSLLSDIISGIETADNENNRIDLFPNPNNGKFRILLTSENTDKADVEVYNLIGEKVWENEYFDMKSTEEIDISGIGKGVYLLRVMSGDRVYMNKFLVQ